MVLIVLLIGDLNTIATFSNNFIRVFFLTQEWSNNYDSITRFCICLLKKLRQSKKKTA